MYDCYCDYTMASLCVTKIRKARIEHKCDECRSKINPGQAYEYTFGIWDGKRDYIKTCQYCVNMRDFVKAHVPCFCWEYFNLHECCIETAREYALEAPGLLFGTYRRSIRRRHDAR